MRSGLVWSVAVSVPLILWVLVSLGGYEYYTTSTAVRAYAGAHRLLRPSGPIGQSFGMAGTALLLVPFLYVARKRVRWMKSAGTMRTWLEVHLFSGVVGPVLITFHTSFKFNGIVSAAYWSMVAVVLSGFVGRYLYVRIPRSIRGSELTQAELDARVEELKEELAHSIESRELFERVDAFDRAAVPVDAAHLSFVGLFIGELTLGHKVKRLSKELAGAGLQPHAVAEVTALTLERAVLMRRIAYLQKTKALFGLWHVFHLPLVYVLLVIVIAHVGVTLYLGYVPFRW